jgi:hypothetical protein
MAATRAAVSPVDLALRVLAAGALAVSAYVHLHLAHLYDGLGSSISAGAMFRAQGIVAALVALLLLVTGSRWAWAAAAGVGAASFAAVMLYRYTSLGAVGPLPNMHDSTWQPSPDKLLSAVVEAAVVVLAVLWWAAVARRSRQRQPVFSSSP